MRVDKGRPRPAVRRGPAKKPPLVAREMDRALCLFCTRRVPLVEDLLSWHTVDPSAWRGTWCEGSMTRAASVQDPSA